MNAERISEALVLLGLLAFFPVISVLMLGHALRMPNESRKMKRGKIAFGIVFAVSSIVIATVHALAFRSSGREHYAYISILAQIFALLPAYLAQTFARNFYTE